MLDSSLRIAWKSGHADDILGLNDGLYVRSERLCANSRVCDDRMQTAIAQVSSGQLDAGAVAVSRPSEKRDWFVLVAPGVAQDGAPPRECLVRIVDPERGASAIATERWSTLFQLTAAETRVAQALVEGGLDLRETAAALGIGYATARAHLARLFQKTGVRNQAQMVRLLTLIDR